MTLRADHVAGAFFICVGLLIIALSGDLPTGTLSLPGSGFMPKILAVLTIFFGLVLTLRASAQGSGATRRNVEVTITRVAGIDPAAEPEIRRLSWRER